MKGLLVIAALLCLCVGCTQQDAIDTWTKNIYPATNNTYNIGSPTLWYNKGYFTNLIIDDVSVMAVNATDGGWISAWDATNTHRVWIRHDGTNGILQTDFSALWIYSPTGIVNRLGDTAGTNEFQVTDSGNNAVFIADSDGNVSCNKITLTGGVWEDLRIVAGSFDRPGTSDPAYVSYTPSGAGTATYLTEWNIGDIATFSVQMPHNYKVGTNISVYLHWTAGARGVAENGNAVGWKVDYSWANMNGNFGAMTTANLSDVCDGTNHKHQMSPEVMVVGTGKDISSMLICNIKRTDTGGDDTWATNTAGNLPLLLEVDFHYVIDSMGSRTTTTK